MWNEEKLGLNVIDYSSTEFLIFDNWDKNNNTVWYAAQIMFLNGENKCTLNGSNVSTLHFKG